MAPSRSQEGGAAAGGVPRHAFREQDAVWAELLAMGDSVVGSLEKSVKAVCEGRIDLIAEVKEEEEESDRKEVHIEEECLRILALFEPVASDLRRMATVLKVNRDWERIADLALRVARRVRKLGRKFPDIAVPDSLKTLARDVLRHVQSAHAALVEIDSRKAREVIAGDQPIDASYRAVRRQLKDQLAARADQLDGWLLLLNSARNLERIADHATGIAQTVVFLQEGKIIRHADPK
ncbi:phosphate signaling complex protein PhoU [Paludisphaera mucosa]|uniref:Phosphate-specific transport system accessory protein PhoU n=1 Tax=Paludisphaera mucosa TaxID=3030827 RepID=A0ABT6FHQ1_9BACT|nr:phosphate signaling complex protein PhoU [Paludisphaera mucosa]MDG3007067.1 phosphate signaling complex protein PhoU [Paludisphaera mucosa]